MIYRHATPRKNLASILKHGLLASKSKGSMAVVWIHSPGKSEWAVLHVVNRHEVKAEDVVILEVDVPSGWLKNSPNRGLRRTTGRDIPANRIVRVLTVADLGK